MKCLGNQYRTYPKALKDEFLKAIVDELKISGEPEFDGLCLREYFASIDHQVLKATYNRVRCRYVSLTYFNIK